MAGFYDAWLSWGGWAGEVNQSMYNLEKMVRLGLKAELGEFEKRRIFHVEEEFYQTEPFTYVKMLSRHKTLGLPTEIDPERKRNLEEIFEKQRGELYNNWSCAAAQRAGLLLPPLDARFVEIQIAAWIEGDPIAKEQAIVWRMMGGKWPDEKNPEFLIIEYITTAHHLRRLLMPNEGYRLKL